MNMSSFPSFVTDKSFFSIKLVDGTTDAYPTANYFHHLSWQQDINFVDFVGNHIAQGRGFL